MSFQKKEVETPDLGSMEVPATEKQIPVPAELLSPAAQSAVNKMISDAVAAAVAAALAANQTPQNSLTSEGLVAALTEAERLRKLPTETEAAKLRRQQREKKAMHAEQENNRKNLELTQSNCPHRYPNNSLAVAQVNNFPDRNPRFCCFKCQLMIHPRHWETGVLPTEDNPQGTDMIVDGHPLWASIAREYAISHQ